MTTTPPNDGLQPRALRALAHPVRIRLLSELRSEGPATASTLAGVTGEAVSLISYHLRQLSKHGFIEEAPELARDARERWWRVREQMTSWSSASFLATEEGRAADMAVKQEILQLHHERLSGFLSEQQTWSDEWVDAAVTDDHMLRLDSTGLRLLHDELAAVIRRFQERCPPSQTDGERVQVLLYAFPVMGRHG
ncbi:ArsR/SmtB family transcription factor [Streptomyces phaeochromogenes]|uniref:ArsR/SmtB family transcription factor n=1 Tax=Streptomyces phaeochromogenes TaxID=1923 RepID=UPI0033C4121D